MTNTTASHHGHIHSRSAMASSTPHKANIDPTDRSIPPVMITSPRPMLKIPNRPMTLARFVRLVADRNAGFLIAVTAHKTNRRTEMPISFFMQSGRSRHEGRL